MRQLILASQSLRRSELLHRAGFTFTILSVQISEIPDENLNLTDQIRHLARDKAIAYAKKGVDRSPNDPIPLIVLSALYGQAGKIDEVVKLLAPQEALMLQDARIAHNYFEALFQAKDMAKLTALLNKLATSPNKEVKQFAIERSRAIAQMLQQQQQALSAAAEAK